MSPPRRLGRKVASQIAWIIAVKGGYELWQQGHHVWPFVVLVTGFIAAGILWPSRQAEAPAAHVASNVLQVPSGWYTLRLDDPGPRRTALLRSVRALTSLNLSAAQAIVASTPSVIATLLSQSEAERGQAVLARAGARSSVYSGSDLDG